MISLCGTKTGLSSPFVLIFGNVFGRSFDIVGIAYKDIIKTLKGPEMGYKLHKELLRKRYFHPPL